MQLIYQSCNSNKIYQADQFNPYFIICFVTQKYVAINYHILYFYNRKFDINDS